VRVQSLDCGLDYGLLVSMSNSVDLNTTDLTSFCLGHALPKLAIQTRKKTWLGLINDMVVNTMVTLEGQALLIADKLCK